MLKKYKVVFCGTPEIGAVILRTLLTMKEVEVVLVVSQPNRPVGRKKEVVWTPVALVAQKHHLELVQPEKIGTEFELIKKLAPDFILTCAYGQLIPEKILTIPKIEALNLHGSLLPKYRGSAPVQYAVWNGETETGVTLMRMVKKMDAGPYFGQSQVQITPTETSGQLFAKIETSGAQLVKKVLPLIGQGKIKPIPQDETQVTFSKKLTPADEQIIWSQRAEQIFNQVRAFNPAPGAYTTFKGRRYKILAARLLTSQDVFPVTLMIHPPGQILHLDKEGVVVQTGTGRLKILTLQKEGKKISSAGVFGLNNFQNGEMFT